MNLKEVLLVGGMGYVGCQLQKSLLKAGYKVHVIDINAPDQKDKDNILFYRSALSEESILREVLQRCANVFYLVSGSVPTTTARSPSREGELNLLSFLKFLNIFQGYNQVRLVYVSSGGTIYGNPKSIPVSESSPVTPISYHGAGKAAIEVFCMPTVIKLITI